MTQSLRTTACIALALAIFHMDQNSSAARIKPRAPVDATEFQIFLGKHVVSVTDTTTLEDLKLEYWKRSQGHILPEYQKVVFNGKQLGNDAATNAATIHQLGIHRNDTLRFTSGLRGGLAYASFRDKWASGYDFVGRLSTTYETQSKLTCTALVQGLYALTAAHCFSKLKGGEPQLRHWILHTTDGKRRLVAGKAHDKYNPSDDSYDVAWVKLDRPHNGQEVVLDAAPVSLDEKVQIAGFGFDEHGKVGLFGVAQFLTTRCESHRIGLPIICARTGPWSLTSTCGGDSGGPWWRLTLANGKYRIFGVQSFGYDGSCAEPYKKSGIAILSDAEDFIKKYTQFEWLEYPRSSSSSSSSGPDPGTTAAHQTLALDTLKTVEDLGVTSDGSKNQNIDVPADLNADEPSGATSDQDATIRIINGRRMAFKHVGNMVIPEDLGPEVPPTRNVWSIAGV